MGWFVAAPGVGETFSFTDTIITAFFMVEVGWEVGAGTVVRSSVTSVASLKEGFFVEATASVLTDVGSFVVIFKSFVVVHTFDPGVWVDESALGLVLGISVIQPHLVVVVKTAASSWGGSWVDTWELIQVWGSGRTVWFPLESWPAVFLPWLVGEWLVSDLTVLAGDCSGIPPVLLTSFFLREDFFFSWDEFRVVFFQ